MYKTIENVHGNHKIILQRETYVHTQRFRNTHKETNIDNEKKRSLISNNS